MLFLGHDVSPVHARRNPGRGGRGFVADFALLLLVVAAFAALVLLAALAGLLVLLAGLVLLPALLAAALTGLLGLLAGFLLSGLIGILVLAHAMSSLVCSPVATCGMTRRSTRADVQAALFASHVF